MHDCLNENIVISIKYLNIGADFDIDIYFVIIDHCLSINLSVSYVYCHYFICKYNAWVVFKYWNETVYLQTII